MYVYIYIYIYSFSAAAHVQAQRSRGYVLAGVEAIMASSPHDPSPEADETLAGESPNTPQESPVTPNFTPADPHIVSWYDGPPVFGPPCAPPNTPNELCAPSDSASEVFWSDAENSNSGLETL